MATDPYVRITLTLNVGGLQDPLDKPGTAHYLEHLLFESLPHRQAIADLKQMGAVMNGHTSIDRMAFYIDVPKVHWKKAVLLIYKMVFKPKFTKNSLNRERIPILAELKYRFQNSHEWLRLRSPFNADLDKDYWRREFNLNLNFRSLIGNEAQVRSVTVADIARYHARNFLPDRMTLTVIGDVHVVDLQNQVESTFGRKIRVSTDVQSVDSDPPSRIKEVVSYERGGFARYEKRYKFYNYSAKDFLVLNFLRGFLEETLNRKLRDEVKITYTLRVELATFAGQAYLGIVSEFQKEDIEVARFFIDQAVDQLRSGSMSESQFESIRNRTLHLQSYRDATSDDLIQWVIKEFYHRPKYDEFPNLTLHHRTVSKERISQFVRDHFHAKDSTIHITLPYPDELQTVLLLTFSLPGLGFLILRSRWKKSPLVSFPMTYQDVHLSWFNWVLMGIGAVTMILLGTSFGHEYLYEKGWHPDQVSSFYAKYVGLVFIYGTPSLLILGIMGSIPRRLYFFERGCRIETHIGSCLSAEYKEVESVEECRLITALFRRHCRSFYTLNPFQKGIHIKLQNKNGIFLLFKEQKEVLTFFQTKLLKNVDQPS